jgi:asparagine synthase (glutamine-hydrolysing)
MMTMANSVEGRVPFAAPAVQQLAEGLSLRQMVHGTELKWLLRKAFADVLPPQVARRPKHGFNVPVDRWLRGEWADMVSDTFRSGSRLAETRLLAPDAAARARLMLEDPQRLNGHTLFCYIMLNLWLEEFASWN